MFLLLCMVLRPLISQGSLLKLRAAFVRACWSSRLTFTHTGTVLGMLDCPECVDPSVCIVWYRFRLLRRYLAYRPVEVARVGRLLVLVGGDACKRRQVTPVLVSQRALSHAREEKLGQV